MLIECVLLSTSLCHAVRDKPVLALTTVQATVMVADGITTRRVPNLYETDPVARAVLGPQPQWDRMAPVGVVLVTVAMWSAERMHRSHTWVRHIWWLPQVLSIGAHSWGTWTNLHY
jgi:hypothetical protein